MFIVSIESILMDRSILIERYFLNVDFPDVFVDNLRIILMRTMTSSVHNLHGKPDGVTE